MFFKYTGMTMEKLREQFKERAEKQVKRKLALEYVAKKEKIKVEEEDYEAEFKRMAFGYGVSIEQVKESIKKEYIEKDLLLYKAFKALKALADISGEEYAFSKEQDEAQGEDTEIKD